jgi:hypothetical protein
MTLPRLVPRLSCLFAAMIAAHPLGAQVGVVPVRPMPSAERDIWVAGRPSKKACIDTSRIAGAIVVDARTVDVTMRGDRRWRLTLAQQCPQLRYYGGFYYQPRVPGKFCAGEDRIISRAGGACRVNSISELRPARRR